MESVIVLQLVLLKLKFPRKTKSIYAQLVFWMKIVFYISLSSFFLFLPTCHFIQILTVLNVIIYFPFLLFLRERGREQLWNFLHEKIEHFSRGFANDRYQRFETQVSPQSVKKWLSEKIVWKIIKKIYILTNYSIYSYC